MASTALTAAASATAGTTSATSLLQSVESIKVNISVVALAAWCITTRLDPQQHAIRRFGAGNVES